MVAEPPGPEVQRNVLGEPLEPCSSDPLTGFHRDGSCTCGPTDPGVHAVCAVMTEEFLTHQASVGNDLSTPRPDWQFPGLHPGDRWWVEASTTGAAMPAR